MSATSEKRKSGRAPGKSNPRRAAGDPEKRQELLDIAVRVIAEQGLQACTFRTLAREAGASTMTYTYEFGTRDSLIEAIIERVFDRTWELRDFGNDNDAEDPLGKLLRAVNLAVQIQPDIDPFQRTLDRFVWEAPYSAAAREKIDQLDAKVASRYHALIDLCKENGSISAERDTDDILMLIWSLGDGLNIQRYAHPEEMPPERMKALFNEGLDRILDLNRNP